MSSTLSAVPARKLSMTIGDRVKQARVLTGVGKAALARKVGVSRSAIGQIESGLTKSPSAKTLSEIAIATATRYQWLLTGKGPMHEEVSHPQESERAHRAGNISVTSGPQTQGVLEVPMTETEYDLLEAFRSLGPADQQAVVTEVQAKAFKAARAAKNPTNRHAG